MHLSSPSTVIGTRFDGAGASRIPKGRCALARCRYGTDMCAVADEHSCRWMKSVEEPDGDR